MAKLGYTSTNEYTPPDFQPLPKGDYPVSITASEICNTKVGGGQYVKLTWHVIAGQYEGRIIFTQHNTINANPDAERIGRGELQGFGKAAGVDMFDDTEELHNKPMIAHVIVEPGQGQYGPKNLIRRASPYKGAAASASAKKPTHQAPLPGNVTMYSGLPASESPGDFAGNAQGAVRASAKAAAATSGSRHNNCGSSLAGRSANPFAD